MVAAGMINRNNGICQCLFQTVICIFCPVVVYIAVGRIVRTKKTVNEENGTASGKRETALGNAVIDVMIFICFVHKTSLF